MMRTNVERFPSQDPASPQVEAHQDGGLLRLRVRIAGAALRRAAATLPGGWRTLFERDPGEAGCWLGRVPLGAGPVTVEAVDAAGRLHRIWVSVP